jgi:hypothetical protein
MKNGYVSPPSIPALSRIFSRLALDSTGALEASYELGDWDEVLDLELDFQGKIWENMGKYG